MEHFVSGESDWGTRDGVSNEDQRKTPEQKTDGGHVTNKKTYR